MIPICITHEANAWHWSSCFHLKPHIQSVMEFWCLDFYRDFTWLWIALEHWRIMYYDMSSPLRRASVDYLTRCTSLVITRHSLCPSNTYRWAWLVTTPFTPQSQTSTRARKGVDPCAYGKAECYTKSALGNRHGSFFSFAVHYGILTRAPSPWRRAEWRDTQATSLDLRSLYSESPWHLMYDARRSGLDMS